MPPKGDQVKLFAKALAAKVGHASTRNGKINQDLS
jgi:hypothetical protein